jgi:hypothetical protein
VVVSSLEAVIGRLSRDRAFRVKYCQDPDGTLSSYLTPEEIRAIKTGDGHGLTRMDPDFWSELTASLCADQPCD